MFQKLLALQSAPLSRFAKFCPSICSFILSWHCAEKFRKHLHKYFHLSFVSSQGGTSKKKTQKKDIRKKSQDVLFLEKQVFQFFLLSVQDLLRHIPWVFWFEIFTRYSLLCVLSCVWDLSLKFVPRDLQWFFYSILPRLKGWFIFVWKCLIIF